MSTVHHQAGNPAAGIPLLHQALELIDPERKPHLLLYARHNLAFYYAEIGRFVEAQKLYREARPLYRSFNEPWVQSRRLWVREPNTPPSDCCRSSRCRMACTSAKR